MNEIDMPAKEPSSGADTDKNQVVPGAFGNADNLLFTVLSAKIGGHSVVSASARVTV